MSESNINVLHTSFENWNVGKVLAKIMMDSHIDSTELSKHTGIPIPTINRLKSEKYSNPTISTLIPIAHYFGITLNQLIGKEELTNNAKGKFNPEARKTTLIPIIPIELAGESLEKNTYSTIATSANINSQGFAIKVKDTISPQFPENAILVFDPQLKPNNRDYVIVRFEGHQKPALRQLLIDGDDSYFKPLSPDLGEIILSKQHTIIAVMIQALTNYRE